MNGIDKNLAFDSGNLLTSEVWRNASSVVVDTLGYSYYDDGTLHTAANSAGTYTFVYDELGRVETVQDIHGITLTYGYDDANNLESLADSEGGLVTSVYDDTYGLRSRTLKRMQHSHPNLLWDRIRVAFG